MKNIVPAMREFFKSGETLSIKYRLVNLFFMENVSLVFKR